MLVFTVVIVIFLMVVFEEIAIARCRTILKSKESATNCVWVLAFDNARIDMSYDEVHGEDWCSPFALALAANLLLPAASPG